MVLLFAVITFLLGWSVRDLLFDRVSLGLSQGDRDRWINTFFGEIGSVSLFALAYSFRLPGGLRRSSDTARRVIPTSATLNYTYGHRPTYRYRLRRHRDFSSTS